MNVKNRVPGANRKGRQGRKGKANAKEQGSFKRLPKYPSFEQHPPIGVTFAFCLFHYLASLAVNA
jgi:hypothetical protein